MKRWFQTHMHQPSADVWLLLLRILLAVFMLTHGYPKLLKLFGPEPIKFADPIGIGEPASLALALFAEVFCSILLAFGLATRLVGIPLAITMGVAVFITHAGQPFGKKELPMLYLFIYVSFMIFGAGKYSVDHYISNRLHANK